MDKYEVALYIILVIFFAMFMFGVLQLNKNGLDRKASPDALPFVIVGIIGMFLAPYIIPKVKTLLSSI